MLVNYRQYGRGKYDWNKLQELTLISKKLLFKSSLLVFLKADGGSF